MPENKKNYVPAAIVAAGAIVAAAILYSGNYSSVPAKNYGNSAAEQTPAENANQADSLTDDDPVLGNPDAPLTIVEFSDFQCPFCGLFFKNAEPQIINNYVKTGKAKFVYRDFAFLGKESESAAMAAECADDQGRFWQYHDALFGRQAGENEGAFSKDNLKKIARELGLNAEQFNSCLDGEKYLSEVRKDAEDGKTAGVSGTPTVFINGKIVRGAVPYEQFKEVIEEELKRISQK